MVQNYGTTQQVTVVDTIGNPVSLGSESNNFSSATEAKQNEAIALLNSLLGEQATLRKQLETQQFLEKITRQLEYQNGSGKTQPTTNAVAIATVQELLPEFQIRKSLAITNHGVGATEKIIIAFNTDAEINKGEILDPGKTWESPNKEKARSRITFISGSGNDIPISYTETLDRILIFNISDPTFANQTANLADITYQIFITDTLDILSSLKVSLFSTDSDIPIETQTITNEIADGAIVNVVFNQIGVIEKTFYLVVKGDE